MADSGTARLAHQLRELRELGHGRKLTQQELATALGRLSKATISTWENPANDARPNHRRLEAYARFFCTPRSLDPGIRLLDRAELTDQELAAMRDLERALDGAGRAATPAGLPASRLMQFDADPWPVHLICPDLPREIPNPLRDPRENNFTKLYTYADVDALIELYAHVRMLNPGKSVSHMHAEEILSADLSELRGHIVLIGGMGWNAHTEALLEEWRAPVVQVEVPEVPDGEIFRVTGPSGPQDLGPRYDTKEPHLLVEDVAMIARLDNPWNPSTTLTLFNGVHSRGVLGAVQCLTDTYVGPGNEDFLRTAYGTRDFAVLARVRVREGAVFAPDLTRPGTRAFEWSPG